MADRVALVTGASRGIGRGIAVALGAADWQVAVNYRGNEMAANQTVAAIQADGGTAHSFQADITISTDRARLIDQVMERYGRIDILVNNAGVAPSQRMDVLEVTVESYEQVMDTNLKGPFFLTQQVANMMIDLLRAGTIESPKIVNISSISAYASSPNRGEYCMSKAGMSMMTLLFADRLAEYGINVYEVRPGIIATDMTSTVTEKYDSLIAEGLTPIRRWGHPDDVAKAVVALAENYLPFSTGEVINVDGGFHFRRL
ncbi:MAG: 3-ketoacyl-ACP reductase [Anaerolineae bacterium]|nr:3-ketoacyl-ACP reductase [Anaerolineae bacterium]